MRNQSNSQKTTPFVHSVRLPAASSSLTRIYPAGSKYVHAHISDERVRLCNAGRGHWVKVKLREELLTGGGGSGGSGRIRIRRVAVGEGRHTKRTSGDIAPEPGDMPGDIRLRRSSNSSTCPQSLISVVCSALLCISSKQDTAP